MIHLTKGAQDHIIKLDISGVIKKEELAEIVPFIKNAIKKHGKLNIIMRINDMEGFTAKSILKDMEAMNNLNSFNKVAILADKDWKKPFTQITDSMTSAEVQFFEFQNESEAVVWINE